MRNEVRCRRRQIHHAFDTVDGLFQRRPYRIGDDPGRGARIDGRDAYRRRRNLGVLGEGKQEERQQADDGHEERKDNREPRTIDEKFRNHGDLTAPIEDRKSVV